MKSYQKIILSFFYTGYLPKMPGTFGSLATLPLIYLFWNYLNAGISIIFFSALTLLSFKIVNSIKLSKKDPSWIVIDEVLGIFLGYILLISFKFSLFKLFLLFGFFRLFDIWKPFPVSTFDEMSFPEAIILDDLVAGIYAGLASSFIFYLLS